MNPLGMVPLVIGIIALGGAYVCFKRAADPMAALERRKGREGVNYTAKISDPQKYSERVRLISKSFGALLGVMGFLGVVAGLAMIALLPSFSELQRNNANAAEARRMENQESLKRGEDDRMERAKHVMEVRPAELSPIAN